jgi:hypothetical protein
MSEHQVQWTAPSPLWPEAASAPTAEGRRALGQPAILRFASDSFMEDFLRIMETDPAQLTGLVARPETWRGPTPPPQATSLLEPAAPMSSFARKLNRSRLVAERSRNASAVALVAGNGSESAQGPPLKLYQPSAQRYYLVTACLVCGITGLPDRALNTAGQERVSFVVRRLFPQGEPNLENDLPAPDQTWDEYALVSAPSGSGWQKIPKLAGATPAVAIPGEERLALFPVSFTEDDGRRRRLFAGLVPVGKREAYMGASKRRLAGEPVPPSEKEVDPRMMLFRSQATDPWKSLIEQASAAKRMQASPAAGDPPSKDEPLSNNLPALARSIKATREQIQTVSWYILLDLAKLLKQYIPNVWQTLMGQAATLNADQTALVNALAATTTPPPFLPYATDLVDGTPYPSSAVKQSLRDALVAIKGGSPPNQVLEEQLEKKLDSIKDPYVRSGPDPAWPSFLFPLADPVNIGPLPPAPPGVADDPAKLEDVLARVSNLARLIEKALPPQPSETLPNTSLASQPLMDPREGWFVIRSVFERPNCGPLEPAIVSLPTRPFQMAGFFDPDAPARPIRIALPVDTSPAGLRKFDKNTAFMISDILCGQINRAKGMSLGDLVRSVLPWPLHKDLSDDDSGSCKTSTGLEVGMICSLSIPIITICALLLLMIIVNLLNMIFRWLPYFLICFPLPGFKGKK